MKRMIALLGLLLICTFTLNAGSAARHATMHLAMAPITTATITTDCEGNACGQVTLTWDENTQQYKAQNNSTDRIVIVEGSNLVATARIRVGAGKTEFLPLKSIVGSYHTNYE